MDYKKFSLEMPDGTTQEYITVFIDEHNAKTFPVDLENVDYVQFLEETK